MPAGPEGQAVRRELRRQRRTAGIGRFAVSAFPVLLAGGFMDQTDVPWLMHPVLEVFGALLPLSVIGWAASRAANAASDRRERRLLLPRPRRTYLLMTLGWALAGGTLALLAWAAGARSTGPGVGEDWIATGLVWGTMISACATLMMSGRALIARQVRRPS